MSEYYPEDHPVWRFFRETPGAGELTEAADVLVGESRSPADGAVLRLSLRVTGDSLQTVRFKAFGCPACIACGAWLASTLEGQGTEALAGVSAVAMAESLQLPATRRHCAVLAEDVAHELYTRLTR